MSAHRHHHSGIEASVPCAVITASDTRSAEDDRSGDLIRERLAAHGHRVLHSEVRPDEPDAIRDAISAGVAAGARAVLITGGTGVGPRDRTYEVVTTLIDRPLPGFGELFRMLSFDEVGAAAMLSRAVAGGHDGVLLVAMPGSPAGVRLALERLVLPELAHVCSELGS